MAWRLGCGGLLGAMLLAAWPACAAPHHADCLDSVGRDQCSAETIKGMLRVYDVEPAEGLAKRGYTGVRIYVVDRRGEPLPLVSVLGAAGRQAQLSVSAPIDRVWEKPRIITGPVARPVATVADTLRARALAMGVAPLPDDQTIWSCAQSWTMVVEVLGEGGVERRVRRHCTDEAFFKAGIALGLAAAENLDRCKGILWDGLNADDTQALTEPLRFLRYCAIIGGPDPQAGSDVHSAVVDLHLGLQDKDASKRFSPDAEMTWGAAPTVRGASAVLRNLRERFEDYGPFIFAYSIDTGGDEVSLHGRIDDDLDESGNFDRNCRWVSITDQIWRRNSDGRWVLMRWVIGKPNREHRVFAEADLGCRGEVTGGPSQLEPR